MKFSNKAISSLTYAHLINDLYFIVLPPLLPLIIEDFNLSYFMAGILLFASTITTALLQPFVGYYADTHRVRKKAIIAGLAFFIISLPIIGAAKSFINLILAAMFMGLGGTTYHPQATSLISNMFRNHRGKYMGIHGVGGHLGTSLGPIVVGALAAAIGWRLGILLLMLPGIVAMVAVWLFTQEPETTGEGGVWGSFTREILLLCIASLIPGIILRGFVAFLPPYYYSSGYNIFYADLISSIVLVAGVMGQPAGGWLSDRIGRKRIYYISFILLGVFIPAFVFIQTLSSLLALFIIGFAIAMTFPVGLLFAYELAPKNQGGSAVGLVFGSSMLGTAFIPPIIGHIVDNFGFDIGFISLAIFPYLGMVVVHLIPEVNR